MRDMMKNFSTEVDNDGQVVVYTGVQADSDEADLTIMALNADIAQSRIEELEDVQISLEQENKDLRDQLEELKAMKMNG
tara:strand:+ start:132 stop:368 length:237 start_codon:yes stop_codon:yes gene_type:complete